MRRGRGWAWVRGRVGESARGRSACVAAQAHMTGASCARTISMRKGSGRCSSSSAKQRACVL
eukprot:6198607-Pleurochrysis_carterae.AAC.3